MIIRERRRKWEIESENVRERKIEHTVRDEEKDIEKENEKDIYREKSNLKINYILSP